MRPLGRALSLAAIFLALSPVAIAAYDRGHEHMLGVADVLTAGLVKQFPQGFRR